MRALPRCERGSVRDEIFCGILGGAIGDAFGSAYEGCQPPVEISEAEEGRLSDDTQLTLATCEAISSRAGSVDPAVIAEQFAKWHRARRVTGMVASTFKALSELAA